MLGWSCCLNFWGHIFGESWFHLDIHTSLTIFIHRNPTAIVNFRNFRIVQVNALKEHRKRTGQIRQHVYTHDKQKSLFFTQTPPNGLCRDRKRDWICLLTFDNLKPIETNC